LGTEGTLSDNITTINKFDPNDTINKNDYSMDVDALQGSAAQGAVSQAVNVTKPTSAADYSAATTSPQIDVLNQTTNAATATFGPDAKVDVEKLDIAGLATGTNVDGSTNEVGQSFNKVYTQSFTNIVDTSTVSGKLLAQNLGEGNYTDAKTQITFWMDTLSKDFVDPVTGNAKIPTWAAGALKGVNRMIAFKGVTGTSAIAAVAAATMETIIPIASEQSKFFQTLTVKNLDAKNTQAINTANILSKMNIADLDSRMTEAITNAKNFISYDMANLDNEQQMTLVKFQAKQQSIMEDGKQENVARQFGATETNAMNKFYDELGSRIEMFNVEARNAMEKFNIGEDNEMDKFNLTMENQREQFYLNFQKDIDESVAKWRQTVELTNNATLNNAAATDVKNIVGLTTEQLNQMWDRTDALLDYSFKESESQKDRRMQIQVAKINYAAKVESSRDRSSPFGKLLGSVAGSVIGSAAGPIGSTIGSKIAGSMFG
jgi:CRISPR/Cas system CSM-associated protein Csm2 small subunit